MEPVLQITSGDCAGDSLANRTPSLLRIEGPADRLPQWQGKVLLKDFIIKALPG